MKKIFLILSILFVNTFCFSAIQNFTVNSFGGYVDNISPDKLNDSPCYSPSLLNVYTDEFNCITKRKGFVSMFSSNLFGAGIKSNYIYTQINNNKYIVFQTSAAIYYTQLKDEPVLIKNGFSQNYVMDYFTAKNLVYASNGFDNPIKSSCSAAGIYTELTVDNSTGILNCPYIEYFRNRSFWAGYSLSPSVVYYSEFNDPENIQSENTLYLNVADGERITGMFQSQGRLYVFKESSMYEVYETEAGAFDFRIVLNNIGCLYQTTISELNGTPVWLSKDGVVLYDGNINIISNPIENFINGLPQLDTERNSLEYGSSSFEGGSFIQDKFEVNTYQDIFTSDDGSIIHARISNSTVHISTDSGLTYTEKILPAGTINLGAYDMSNKGNVALCGVFSAPSSYSLYKTTDNWDSYNLLITTGGLYNCCTSSDGVVVAMTGSDGSNYTILVSSDSGNNFYIGGRDSSIQYFKIDCDDTGNNIAVVTYSLISPSIFTSTQSFKTPAVGTGNSIGFGNILNLKVSSNGNLLTCNGGTGLNYYVNISSFTPFSGANHYVIYPFEKITTSNDMNVYLVAQSTSPYSYIYYSTDYCVSFNTITLTNFTTGFTDIKYVNDTQDIYYSLNSNDYLKKLSVNSSYSYEISTATNWGSWGTLESVENLPSGCSIDYFVKTSTSIDIIDDSENIPVTNYFGINSNAGEFIKLIATFTANNFTYPNISSAKINYYSVGYNPPCGVVYNGRYYLSVSTGGLKNDCTICFQKTLDWTRLNIGFNSACIYKNNWYTGSTSGGMLYRQDTGYNDDGLAYPAYWRSKYFEFNEPYSEKILYDLWIKAENSGDWNLGVKYRLDGERSEWKNKTLSLYSDYGFIVGKIPFKWATKGYSLQLQFENNNADEYFQLRGFSCKFDIKPQR